MNISEQELQLSTCLQGAKELYEKQSELFCPYFSSKITLNADGFNHLQYKLNRLPRNLNEQIYKLSLLKKVLKTIPKCGTVQEYRDAIEKIGKRSADGFFKTKRVQYWGFVVLLENKKNRIKIILKQVGDGNVIFWSVMPVRRRAYTEGIEED